MKIKKEVAYYLLLRDGYTGSLSCALKDARNGCNFYTFNTSDGAIDVACYDDNPLKMFFYREPGSLDWYTNTGETAMEINGLPYVLPGSVPSHYKRFADCLQEYRETHGMTIPQLAEFIGTEFRTVEDWIRSLHEPAIFTIKTVLRALGYLE